MIAALGWSDKKYDAPIYKWRASHKNQRDELEFFMTRKRRLFSVTRPFSIITALFTYTHSTRMMQIQS